MDGHALRDRLDDRLATRRLHGRHVRTLARALASFHESAALAPSSSASTSVALARRSRALGDRLEALAGGAGFGPDLHRLLVEQQRFLAHEIDALLDRVAGGRIRSIHGRLRCHRVHVSRLGGACFAESDARACGDVAEDVADLALELRARGGQRPAEQLVAAYALAADDYELFRVLRFHEGEAALRLALEGASETGRRAGRPGPAVCVRAALGGIGPPPSLIATGGSVAAGKSTLAKVVSRRLAIPRIVADRVRNAILAPLPDGVAHELSWDPSFFARGYRAMLQRAESVLRSGRSVILDACFPTAERRREAASLAERCGARFVFVHCDPAPEDVAARLLRRDARDGSPPGCWQTLARRIAAAWEPPGADEPGRCVRIDTGRPRAEWLRALGIEPEETP